MENTLFWHVNIPVLSFFGLGSCITWTLKLSWLHRKEQFSNADSYEMIWTEAVAEAEMLDVNRGEPTGIKKGQGKEKASNKRG